MATAAETRTQSTPAQAQAPADGTGKRTAVMAALGLHAVPQYNASPETLAQQAESQAHMQETDKRTQTAETPAKTAGKGAARAARKAQAEQSARAQSATPATPASTTAGIAGAATVPAGKLRYTRTAASAPTPERPAKAAKAAGNAPAKAAQSTPKAPKADKPAAPVYTDSTPALDAITTAHVYRWLGGKLAMAALAAEQRAGKAQRWGNNADHLLWWCGRAVESHKAHAGLGLSAAAPEQLYRAARALAKAIDAGDLAPHVYTFATDRRPTNVLYLLAELAARRIYTPSAAAAHCNGWHLLPGGDRAGYGTFYRRVYHLPAAEQTAHAQWLAAPDSMPAGYTWPLVLADAPETPATPAKAETDGTGK